jgi:hypothetical protein
MLGLKTNQITSSAALAGVPAQKNIQCSRPTKTREPSDKRGKEGQEKGGQSRGGEIRRLGNPGRL